MQKLDRYPTPDELLSGRVGIFDHERVRETEDREEEEILDVLLDLDRG